MTDSGRQTPNIDAARAVADAVLLEGYVLYPYYASADKNRLRWQFGVLVPPGAESTEPGTSRTECLVDPRGAAPSIDVTVRFLQVQDRLSPDLPWQEGVIAEVTRTVTLHPEQTMDRPFDVSGGDAGDGRDGVTRRRQALSGLIRVHAERLDGPYGTLRLRVEVINTTAAPHTGDADREDMLRYSLVSTHVLLAAHDGKFLSLLDPPEWAKPAAQSCTNLHTYPVLVGEGREDVLLSSPIILYDYPAVAPESAGDLCDATEIDEILTLRTMALTDEEKRQARATDPKAAEIIDRADSMPPEMLERLHGTVRYLRGVTGENDRHVEVDPAEPGAAPWWDPGADASVSPENDALALPDGYVRKGSRVSLYPRTRGTDAQDMFLAGRTATVAAVFFDVDGSGYVAVTLEDDLAADLHGQQGRYLYFAPEEVQLLPATSQAAPSGANASRSTLVAGVGNIFLGDDGFGVEVAQRLQRESLPEGVQVADFGIRGMHLAYELMDGYDELILIDAAGRGEQAGTVYMIEPDMESADSGSADAPAMNAHGMDPETVFATLRQLGGRVERALIVGCEPADTSDGIGLSGPVTGAVDEATRTVLHLLADGDRRAAVTARPAGERTKHART